ncbi:hypothetical protein ABIE13_000673 [Ottowia thiooxydans]|uniref:Uncharacterized protein n=1 Tax=Ottowia thiooxydans TaxID=219182 RepID=A0ABV2Q3G9_9BURK
MLQRNRACPERDKPEGQEIYGKQAICGLKKIGSGALHALQTSRTNNKVMNLS